MNFNVFNRGVMRTALGCAGLALVLSISGCSDSDRAGGLTPSEKGIDLGVLAAEETADVFLFNDGAEEASVTLLNTKASTSSKAAIALKNPRISSNFALSDYADVEQCATMRLRQKFWENHPNGVLASKDNGEIQRNTRYRDMAVGEQENMWICYVKGEQEVEEQFPFQKIYEGDNVIVMAQVVDENPVFSVDKAKEIDTAFGVSNPYDEDGYSIRKRVNETFGKEWTDGGGKDATDKIIIAVTSAKNFSCGGYYYSLDATDEAHSNKGEILYLDAWDDVENPDDFFGEILRTVAHEYQHMCHCNQRYIHDGKLDGTDEGVMVDEGCSVLTEQMVGMALERKKDGEELPGSYGHMHMWLSFLAQGWAYQFGDFWDEEAVKLGGDLYGCYGKAGALMRYIADVLGFESVSRIAQGKDANGQNMDSVGVEGIEKATNKDFAAICQGVMTACTNYTDAPAGMAYKNMEFKTYTVAACTDDGKYEVEDVALEPLTPMGEAEVSNLTSEKITLAPAAGGYFRIKGDGKTSLTLKTSQLDSNTQGGVVVSSGNKYEKRVGLKDDAE